MKTFEEAFHHVRAIQTIEMASATPKEESEYRPLVNEVYASDLVDKQVDGAMMMIQRGVYTVEQAIRFNFLQGVLIGNEMRKD